MTGGFIRGIRTLLGLQLTDMARQTGLSITHLSMIETNQRRITKAVEDKLKKLFQENGIDDYCLAILWETYQQLRKRLEREKEDV